MFAESSAGRLVEAARSAAGNEALIRCVAGVYRYAQARTAAWQPVCRQCGRCCHFDRLDHRLFISTVEFAYFIRVRSNDWAAEPLGGMCPFLRIGPVRCAARAARPLGCRLFYCHESCQSAARRLFEGLHLRVRRLHERFGVPYYYCEWLSVLHAARRAGR